MKIPVKTIYSSTYRVPYVVHDVGSRGKQPLGLPSYGYSPPIVANSELEATEYWRDVLKGYGLHFSIKPNSIILE